MTAIAMPDRPLQLAYACPSCGRTQHVSVSGSHSALTCAECTWSRPLEPHNGPPARCLVCGCGDLWRQKDFPQRVGVALVGLAALLSTVAYAWHWPRTALAVLMGFALVDFALYLLMGDVLVCYRCGARHRCAEIGADHPRFNLELHERYRQEAQRLKDAAGTHA